MPALLEAQNVTKIFGGGVLTSKRTIALEHLSLAIDDQPPSFTAIVGESGSGKTTLARVLLGLETPTSGAVYYKGKNLTKMSRTEYRTYLREVQVIFQDPYEVYNPFYTVDHVLETPIIKFNLGHTRTERRRLMDEALEAVGLRPEETLGRFPHQLSGGQRQRIMVARALVLRPRVIIADEPVSMVDASLRATILTNLQQLNQRFGISFIYITHDLTTAYQVSDNILVLYRGGVAEAGSVERVVQEPEHPYTQLLIGSIPLPDPRHSWMAAQPPAQGLGSPTDASCRFVDRCPHAMPMCVEKRPPLFRTDPRQAVACFLYGSAPTITAEELPTILTSRVATVDDQVADG